MNARLIMPGVALLALAATAFLLSTHPPGTGNSPVDPAILHVSENPDSSPGSQDPTLHAQAGPDKQTADPVNPDNPVAANTRSGNTSPPNAEHATAAGDGDYSISGLVVDEFGTGIAGIELDVSQEHRFSRDAKSSASKAARTWTVLTDDIGWYALEGVNDGEYRVRAEPEQFYEPAQAMVRAGQQTADLVLRARRPDVHVSGTVQSDGEPLDSVSVQVIGQAGGAVQTNGDGYYQLDMKFSESRSRYTLSFVREGFREKRSVIELEQAGWREQLRLDAELEPVRELARVSGAVYDVNGKSLADQTVRLYSESARQRYAAVSDRNGEFSIDEIETGSDYLVSVQPGEKYRDYKALGVEISRAGEDLEVVLEPLAQGTLIGQMVDAHGQPVPEFSLWLRNPDAVNQADILVTGDSQGFFRVDEVEEGNLVFESRSSPQLNIKGIHLSAGEQKDVLLVLDWGNHQVAGLVVDDMGRPVPASELYVTSLRRDSGVRAHTIRRAVTDETGYFLVNQVGPGYHTIRIDVPGFQTTIIDHDVGVSAPEVVIRLERASSHGM
jgi:hypothetical protein